MTVGGTPLLRDVILRDGTPLRLRAPAPADYDDIKAFYDGLSEDSRYTRFHGSVRTEGPARSDAEADGDTRVVLIGWRGDRVVASGSYDRLREPAVAEVAFTVADDFQGRGVATRVLEQLAEIGAERGIARFDAEVMDSNQAMLAVFNRAGFGVRNRLDFDQLLVSLDIQPTEAVQEKIEERDHIGVVASLRSILAPASVAVVGASNEPGNAGGGLFANLIAGGFQGAAVPVNRGGGVVHSVRAARSLGELAEPPELVVVAVPDEEVLDVAAEAARIGAKAMLVVSSLAGDTGEGSGRQRRLLEIVRSAGLRMVGPGTLGVLNNDASVRLRGTFAGAPVPAGRLAISSQSGAIGIALLGDAAARRLGLSSFASLGDRADVSTNDLLEYWEEDQATAAVILYVETFGNPERFGHIARRVARRKPILAIKGRMAQNPDAEAGSHTAAALRGDALVDALLLQAGVMRFHSDGELFDTAEFFGAQPLPLGRRMGIVSNSRGVATLAADACGSRGLAVGRSLVIGYRAGPADYATSMQALLTEQTIDAVMASYVDVGGGDPQSVLAAISQAAAGQTKPVVASVLGSDGRRVEPQGGPVPNFHFPETCAGVLARAVERREWLSRALGQRPDFDGIDAESARARVAGWLDGHPAEGTPEGSGWLPTAECEALLATHGIPFVASESCSDVEQAVSSAAALRGPVVLKADFPPPAHAADVDAVLLGLEGEAAARAGWQELERRCRAAGREWRGVTVQPLVGPGADVLLGALADPDLGQVMAIGLGGRQAGLGRDVAFRLVPLTDVDARELIDASETLSVQLEGFRGSLPLDRPALQELILRFATLLRAVPELVEVDLNPVRCLPDGALVLDVRMRVERRVHADSVTRW
jgi:acyl-CoA synthetase (NDP forming)/RimJ/RimL family protein N-acetyltransferase